MRKEFAAQLAAECVRRRRIDLEQRGVRSGPAEVNGRGAHAMRSGKPFGLAKTPPESAVATNILRKTMLYTPAAGGVRWQSPGRDAIGKPIRSAMAGGF